MPRLLHASGEFNQSASWLLRDLRRWIMLASIITLTEVSGKLRKAALRIVGWRLTTGSGEGPGECAILSNRLLWRGIERFMEPITKGGGKDRLSNPIYAVTDVLHRRGTGRTLIVSTCHMPAHVETLLRLGAKAQPATTWRQAANLWAAHVAEVRAKYPDADVWVVADWNVDARRDWARRTVRDAFRTAGADLQVVRTEAGTHEDRVIDFALSTLSRDTAVTHKAEASDHDAASFRMHWSTNRRKP